MTWNTDILGPDFEAYTIDLGLDPVSEGSEGNILATLVRHKNTDSKHAIYYVHGMSDYFFQKHVAEFFVEHGFAFYGIDLRKCGRSHRPGQRPHHITDMALYDEELNAGLDIIAAQHEKVTVMGHSTGGLIVPMWLSRNANPAVVDVVLNSPWFDLPVEGKVRNLARPALKALKRFVPEKIYPEAKHSKYAQSLLQEWDFDTTWKPIINHKKAFIWLAAVAEAQATLHKGLGLSMPILVMRSDKSALNSSATNADTVLLVDDMQYWAPRLGNHVAVEVIANGMHDLFLSPEPVRSQALDVALQFIKGNES
ncbi:MAG: alpha/beta hydrolase [Corynebacterium sp.]|nr:alpha/beta hydrolase [Corynebacterium sp.]